MGTEIIHIEYYLPEKTLTSSQLENKFRTYSGQNLEKKLGIRLRHIAGDNETALDLAQKAAEKIFEQYDKNLIDYLLLCTQSPDYLLPTSACILQERLGLRTDIGALDFSLGCSGFIYGLSLAKGLIAGGIARNVLLLTSDTYSKHIHEKDYSNLAIFGDGAAAAVVTQFEREKIFKFVLGTDGRGHKNLIVPSGGMRARSRKDAPEKRDVNGSIRTDNHMFMDGPEIFNFTISTIPELVDRILEANDSGMQDIDYVIFHQANSYILDYLRKKMKIPRDKFFNDIAETGNTVSASIPIALRDCLDRRIIKAGSSVLLVGFGVGYSWGGTIIEL
ncbi:MAG: ketoacyl-ACP synthase III [Syntrophales bacterium]|nr:ketoacyl-ACP synthase III [Syntrophales bacterium]